MYGYIGLGLFVLTLLILIYLGWKQWQRHLEIIVSLSIYAKWLLLDDAIRDNHKGKFKEFLKTTSFRDDNDLFIVTDHTIEAMATSIRGAGSFFLVIDMMRKEIKN